MKPRCFEANWLQSYLRPTPAEPQVGQEPKREGRSGGSSPYLGCACPVAFSKDGNPSTEAQLDSMGLPVRTAESEKAGGAGVGLWVGSPQSHGVDGHVFRRVPLLGGPMHVGVFVPDSDLDKGIGRTNHVAS